MTSKAPYPADSAGVDGNGRNSGAGWLGLLYADLPMAAGSNILLASVLAGLLWPVVDAGLAVSWLALVVIAQLGRLGLWRRYRAACQAGNDRTPTWLQRFRLGAVATGALWGAGAWLLFPAGEFAYQVFMAWVDEADPAADPDPVEE